MTDRRQFLKTGGAISLAGGAGLYSTLANFSAQASDTTGYKALVCVFLFGGLDCHDTVLPYDQASYDRYAEIRASLLQDYAALPGGSTRDRDRLLTLNPINASQFGSRQFALPPEMSAIKALFDNGNAAIIGNVGPLLEPISKSEFETYSPKTPKRLFSHNDQQSTWLAMQPEGAQFGWGGLFADQAIAANANQTPALTAISSFGNTVFLAGNNTVPYELGADGVQLVGAIENENGDLPADLPPIIRQHMESVGVTRSNLYERDMVNATIAGLQTSDVLNAGLTNASSPLTTAFPQTFLAAQLRTIAQTINIRADMNASRQVFFVGIGGFDTHSRQANELPGLQQEISEAVAAFYLSTIEMGAASDVTLFTASDFGRTLTINGDGTDHGWGAHHFVVGGGVNGNRIYGDIPLFDYDHANDAGNGRLIPSVSVEQMAGTMGRWFGLTPGEIAASLPALSNFTQQDLGFV